LDVLGIWVFPKIGGTAKMDGENDGNPYFLMDDFGVPLFSETSICWTTSPANFIEIPNLVVVFQPPKTSPFHCPPVNLLIAMEHPPFEDALPNWKGEFPLPLVSLLEGTLQ